jgi:hypothetical protein
MTMFLMDSVVIKLKKSDKGDGWFEFDGPVELLDNESVAEWLANDFYHEQHKHIEGAKVVGIHDRDDDIATEDPRFEDGFAVIYFEEEDAYNLLLDVNLPEAAILRHLLSA